MSRRSIQDDRGAILVYVSVVIVILIAFTALTVDYGVSLVGRRQAQNSADAAALAGAISLSYVNRTDFNLARNSAIAAANANRILNAAPDIVGADVTFPPCPPGAPGVGGTCVEANVFRTSYGRTAGSPLPTFFANIVGVGDQGARATATAQLLTGSGTADCVKPWGIPDRWQELRPQAVPWTSTSTFERYQQTGGGAGSLLNPADLYVPPSNGSPGTGFTLPNDYGLQLRLYVGTPQDTIMPGFFYPLRIDPDCRGGDCYREAIAGCSNVNVGPGTVLSPEPGAMRGPTRQGVADLIALDPNARWNAALNNGTGGIEGGCMAPPNPTCARSPRLVAIPVFNVDAFNYATATGGGGASVPINVVKVIGFFFEGFDGNGNNANIVGRITHYPTTSLTGTPLPGQSQFASTVILVR